MGVGIRRVWAIERRGRGCSRKFTAYTACCEACQTRAKTKPAKRTKTVVAAEKGWVQEAAWGGVMFNVYRWRKNPDGLQVAPALLVQL